MRLTYFFYLVVLVLSTSTLATESQTQAAQTVSSEQSTKRTFKLSPEMQQAIAIQNQATEDHLSTSERLVKYVHSGIVHIVPRGLDHILFVLGLFFSTVMFSKLVWQVSVFTLAHTLTLALASLGWVKVSASVVEPLIALSIVLVAIENVRHPEPDKSRLGLIFLFGLLHGLGFAFVLSEFGLPDTAFLVSLIGFNIGVEIGQLSVIAAALVLFYTYSKKPSYRMFVQIPGSVLIGFVGLYWSIERLL